MAILFVLLALAISAFLALRRPKSALLTAVFFIPWAGLDVDIGLRVTAYLIFITPLFFGVALRALSARGPGNVFLPLGVLNFLVLYAIVWSLAQVPFLPEASISGGSMREPMARSVVQVVMFLITLSPLLVVPALIRNATDLRRLGQIYLASTVVLAMIGWLQLGVWTATGSDPLPVGFFDNLLGGSATNRSGVFSYEGGLVYRMSSFGGEPKGMGASLAVALLLLQSGIPIKSSLRRSLWYFLFASMVATFSTMGLLAWFGASLVQFFTTADLRLKLRTPKFRISRSGLLSILIASTASAMIAFSPAGNRVIEMVEMRTVDRVTEVDRGYLEDFNVAITDFLLDQPLFLVTGVGLGNVHLYANDYLPIETQWYAAGKPFVAKSLALKLASELGLAVVLVFSYWVIFSLQKAASFRRRVKGLEDVTGSIAKFGLPLFAFVLVSVYVTPHFFMMLGCAFALVGIARHEIRGIKWSHRAQGPSEARTTN